MTTSDNVEEAIEVLQTLGLKEYEAKCFVGLSRMPTGTAKKLSEITDVPRTRIYDAIRVLEAQGLVEVQHTSPQQFRAVPLDEATETLAERHESRIDRLTSALEDVEKTETDSEPVPQEVWSMSGTNAIENRTNKLIEEADDEVVLVIGAESLLTEDLVESLNRISNRTDLLVGALSPALEDHIHDSVPRAETFVSGLEWLQGENGSADETAIGRLVLIDRSTILVSSIVPETKEQHAIFGRGFGNGLVVIARRLMAQGLLASRDPAGEEVD